MATCRGCGVSLDPRDVFCDLGTLPSANALLSERDLSEPEYRHPLRPLVCRKCLLVQLPQVPDRERLFTRDYPFFSGQSVTWMAHCKEFARMAKQRFGLGATSRVLEIGSNDGTMLAPFRGLGVPAVGVEPCEGVAQHAQMEGLTTIIDWWGTACAERLLATGGVPTGKGWRANLIVANNVLAHVPDLQDFLAGVRMMLAPGGVAVFEVPYVGNLIAEAQFDQIYAEHHCYFSLTSLAYALERAGLHVVDVERVLTHGGSLRVFAQNPQMGITIHGRTQEEFNRELLDGYSDIDTYLAFAAVPPIAKRDCLRRLVALDGQRVAAYGASAKASTLLAYLGVGTETIPFTVDVTPGKWGYYLPGSRIPIRPPEALQPEPDVVLNLLWNWREESEANIRRVCPNARIEYLRPPVGVAA